MTSIERHRGRRREANVDRAEHHLEDTLADEVERYVSAGPEPSEARDLVHAQAFPGVRRRRKARPTKR